MRQRWRLAEIRAEDYAFVLFSSFLNQLSDKVLQQQSLHHLSMPYALQPTEPCVQQLLRFIGSLSVKT